MKQSNQSLKKQNPTVVAAGNLTHKSEKEISMKNCNTTIPNEQALTTVLSNKRCLAVAINLLNNPSGLTRKQLEATCGTGYSPNEIEELRWNGGLSIPYYRETGIDKHGKPTWWARYYLTDTDRSAIVKALPKAANEPKFKAEV